MSVQVLVADLGLPQVPDMVSLAIGGVIALTVIIGFVLAGRRARTGAASQPVAPMPTENGSGRNAAVTRRLDEMRQTQRRAGGNVAVEIANAKGIIKPYQGWIVDRSEAGLCLGMQEELAVGTVLKVRPVYVGDPLPFVPIQVRSCRKRGATWDVGCEYLERPNATLQMLFG